MTEILQHPLSYQADPTELFELLIDMPWAQLLDSGGCGGARGRYDIISADPYLKITSFSGTSRLTDRYGNSSETQDEPFELLKQRLLPFTRQSPEIPFCGGAMGYFGYDLLPESTLPDTRPACIHDLPELAIGIYDWAIVTDHQKQQTYFVSTNRDNKTAETLKNILTRLEQKRTPDSDTPALLPLTANQLETDTGMAAYQSGFRRIQKYLLDGDCYQINYARCFHAAVTGSAWQSYKLLRQANPMPFGAFLDLPFAHILSASPERFIQVTGNRVETRPIKGTRPRSSDPVKDQLLKTELSTSAKDRAENLMIVDLLRNDLGKNCSPGSIHVPELFSVESYPTVFHLVSSIKGTIAEGKTAIDVLRDCFPGGRQSARYGK